MNGRTARNYGYPSGMWIDVPMSGEHLGHVTQTAWSMEQMQIPQATEATGKPISLDAAMAAFDRLGVTAGYAVELPADEKGVFTASVFPDDVSKQRVVHLDQYTGEPLIDVGYANYGPLAKSLEWGINVHLGQQYGLANQLVLLGVCMCVVLLAVAAAVMWWKRRPAGSLGIPPMPQDRRVFRGLLFLLAVGGIIFPLVGSIIGCDAGARLALFAQPETDPNRKRLTIDQSSRRRLPLARRLEFIARGIWSGHLSAPYPRCLTLRCRLPCLMAATRIASVSLRCRPRSSSSSVYSS